MAQVAQYLLNNPDQNYKLAIYKNKSYRLTYIGFTKYGYRAKLEFLDNSQSFWVDGKAVFQTGEDAPKYLAPKKGTKAYQDECDRLGISDDDFDDYAYAFEIDIGDK